MPLSVGDRLGPYEILAPIGSGGMGEVYKARDTRLNREVAIKVSKDEFSERFEREARAVAALNHPNICQLYDVGPNYLVMEYIEGAPLKGLLPLDQALKYAGQICAALDAAHKKNITHRDLKPPNIMVTKQGIKLLDFGIAKVGLVIKAEDATMTMALTGKGEILGTLVYMSPEQVNGEEAGPRSDIFSFGLVLYEMLTGERAFGGKSQASVIAAILERPAPSASNVAPPALDRVLRKCLAKDPDDRWQTARDLKDELEWITSAPGEAIASSAPSSRPAGWLGRLTGIAAVIAIAVALGTSWVAYRATRPAELKPLVRLDVDLGPEVSLESPFGPDVILSPDGNRLVYVSQGRLFTRRLDQLKATELAGTEGASSPFFSPDGHWVAFFAPGKLKKISVEGGAAIALCDSPDPQARSGSWGEDDNIIAALASGGGLSRVPSAGGTPMPVTEMAQGEVTHRWPQILPGGKAVLFTANTSTIGGFDGANIEVLSLTDHRRKTLVRGGTYGRYLPSGHLIYVNRGTLFAVPLDLDTLSVRGTSVPLLEDVDYTPNTGAAQLDFSRTATLVYRSGGGVGGLVTVQWLDSAGKAQPLLTKPGAYGWPRLSPDGQRLAMAVRGDIWVYDWKRDNLARLTFARGTAPVWSPDGRYIAFETLGGMSWTRADATGKPEPLTQNKNFQNPWSFTPDGKRLAFHEVNPGKGDDLWTLPLENDGGGLRPGKPEIFLQTPFDERQPSFSPDGRWIAYASDESGTFQVYVRAFPDNGAERQISNDGGQTPVWSRNGRELFFETLNGRVMVASYLVNHGSFVVNKPRVWSEKQLFNSRVVGNYDLAPDGKRIAALIAAEREGPREQTALNRVIFLQNFFDELRRRVPASK